MEEVTEVQDADVTEEDFQKVVDSGRVTLVLEEQENGKLLFSALTNDGEWMKFTHQNRDVIPFGSGNEASAVRDLKAIGAAALLNVKEVRESTWVRTLLAKRTHALPEAQIRGRAILRFTKDVTD